MNSYYKSFHLMVFIFRRVLICNNTFQKRVSININMKKIFLNLINSDFGQNVFYELFHYCIILSFPWQHLRNNCLSRATYAYTQKLYQTIIKLVRVFPLYLKFFQRLHIHLFFLKIFPYFIV